MIEKYGADPVRLSLVVGTSPGNNMNLSENKIAGYRNYVNKIWNAARFACMQLEGDGRWEMGDGRCSTTSSQDGVYLVKDPDEIEKVKQFILEEAYAKEGISMSRKDSMIDGKKGVKEQWFLAKKINEKIVGASCLKFSPKNEYPFYIGYMVVEKKLRGNGIGNELAQSLIALATSKKAKRLSVNSRERAINFYENLGFKKTGKKKTWNGIKLVKMTIDETESHKLIQNLSLPDQWLLSRLYSIIQNTEKNLENFEFSKAGEEIYLFFWREFCDVYLEIQKKFPNPELLKFALETLLKLLHPFVPFVTESIWKNLGHKDFIFQEEFPESKDLKKYENKKIEKAFAEMLEIQTKIRDLRSRGEFPSKENSFFYLDKKSLADLEKLLNNATKSPKNPQPPTPNSQLIMSFLWNAEYLAEIECGSAFSKEGLQEVFSEKTSFGEIRFFGLNFEKKSSQKNEKELEELEKAIAKRKKLLSNKNFVKNAPAKVVEMEKEKLRDDEERLKGI